MWYVYLLYNEETRRTYVGATTDPWRRLRQHRGELRGGAKATKKAQKSWDIICYLSGFQDRRQAYRWEKLIKARARGQVPRYLAFLAVSKGRCPEDPRKPHLKAYEVPPGLDIHFVLKFSPESSDKASGGAI